MSKQKALWLPDLGEKFVLGEHDIPEPGPGEVLVKNYSVGLNPMDWIFQKLGFMVKKYPTIIGGEAAGVVHKIGEGVSSFGVGDKVFYPTADMEDRYGCYQEYTIALEHTVGKVPDNLTFDQAASICIGILPFASMMYCPEPHAFGYTPPFENMGGVGKYKSNPILIVGGSTSVGQYAIQLSKLSGFSPIITVASLRNEEYLLTLGATHVLDRLLPIASASFHETLKEILGEIPLTCIFDIFSQGETQQAVYDNLLAPGGNLTIVQFLALKEDETSGKHVRRALGSILGQSEKLLSKRFMEELTQWLAKGTIKPNRVEVLPGGLNAVEEGVRRLENGTVSARKLVVRIADTA